MAGRNKGVLTFEGTDLDDGMEDCDCAFADADADLSYDAVPRLRKKGGSMARRKKRTLFGLDLDAVPGVGGVDLERVKKGAIIGGVAAASTVAVGALLDKVASKLDPTYRDVLGAAIGVVGGGLVYQATKRDDLATAVMVGPFFTLAQTLIGKVTGKGLAAEGYDAYDIVAVEGKPRYAGLGQYRGYGGSPMGLIAPENVAPSYSGSNGMGLVSAEPQNPFTFAGSY